MTEALPLNYQEYFGFLKINIYAHIEIRNNSIKVHCTNVERHQTINPNHCKPNESCK
jgi:hypothetical protein